MTPQECGLAASQKQDILSSYTNAQIAQDKMRMKTAASASNIGHKLWWGNTSVGRHLMRDISRRLMHACMIKCSFQRVLSQREYVGWVTRCAHETVTRGTNVQKTENNRGTNCASGEVDCGPFMVQHVSHSPSEREHICSSPSNKHSQHLRRYTLQKNTLLLKMGVSVHSPQRL